MESKCKIFVIMPFDTDNLQLYDTIKARLGNIFDFSHAGEEDNQQNILADIVPPIFEADVVIADLTGLNPNVMYELGVAHSLSKKTIMITRDDLASLPFDLKQYRTINYSTHFAEFEKLIQNLEKNLNGAIDGSVDFSNPVTDFLKSRQTSVATLASQKQDDSEYREDDKGFLDFLAEIESNTELLTSSLNTLSDDMSTMTDGTIECAREIERIKKSDGKKRALLAQLQTQKAAKFISTFSEKLKTHNTEISRLWCLIERNIIGLIENEFATKPENLNSLLSYLNDMPKLKEATISSQHGIESMKDSLQTIRGIERKLNQASQSLEKDLDGYLSVTDEMCASIDRIELKSRHLRSI